MRYLLIIGMSLLPYISNCQKSFSNTNTDDNTAQPIINLDCKNCSGKDTFSLSVYNENTLTEFESNLIPPKIYSPIYRNNYFEFALTKINKPTYFSISKRQSGKSIKIISYYLTEPGDTVTITILSDQITFQGKGAEKYKCKYDLDNIYKKLSKGIETSKNTSNYFELAKNIYVKYDSIKNNLLGHIEKYRNHISTEAFQRMTADIIGKSYYQIQYGVGFLLFSNHLTSPDTLKAIRSWQSKYIIEPKIIPVEVLAKSKDYVNYLFQRGMAIDYILANKERSYYTEFKDKHKGLMREKLLTLTIIKTYKYLTNPDSLVNDALAIIRNGQYRQIIEGINTPQRAGAIFNYNFSLVGMNEDTINLNKFKNKIIFLDFWYVGCRPCVNYYKNAVSKAEVRFRNNPDVVFISICTEKSKKTWLNAIESLIYTSKENINLYTGGVGNNHPLISHYSVISAPKPILVGKDGRIVTANANELGHGMNPSAEILINKIQDSLSN